MTLSHEVFPISNARPPYAPEFLRQMIDLVRDGRGPSELAHEFERFAHAVRDWAEADRLDDREEPPAVPVNADLPADERDELSRLRGVNKNLKLGRDVLCRAAEIPSHIGDGNPAWFASTTGAVASGFTDP